MTQNPTAAWLARQITESFPWDTAPKYLIRDNDRAFGGACIRSLAASIIGMLESRFPGGGGGKRQPAITL